MKSKDFSASKLCLYENKDSNLEAKKAVFYAFLLTLLVMIAEIISGSVFNSMALLADGWHMGSHTLALGLVLFGYILANHYTKDARFNFGTYKIEILTAYTSAILLFGVAFLMAYHSVEYLINPVEIAYIEAIIVAFLGLFVNTFCMWLLKNNHSHNHGHAHKFESKYSHGHLHSSLDEFRATNSHTHKHENSHEHFDKDSHFDGKNGEKISFQRQEKLEKSQYSHYDEALLNEAKGQENKARSKDLNLKVAYIHVLTDALTSVLAIIALFGGLFFGFAWLDAAMGLLGSVLVLIWAIDLIGQSSKILLDMTMDEPILDEVLSICKGFGELKDLHLLKISKDQYALILSLQSDKNVALIKENLRNCKALGYICIELV